MKMFVSVLLTCALLVTAGVASAHVSHGTSASTITSTQATVVGTPMAHANKGLSVVVNGVEVKSEANHFHQSQTYVSVEAFANLFGKSFELSDNNQSVTFNGKEIQVRMAHGEPTAWIRDLSAAVNATKVSWNPQTQEAYVLVLPEGTIQLEPFPVPAMGEHWANPAEMPIGPIYGVFQDKLIFIEYMIPHDDFINGVSHVNLDGMKGVPSPAVVQTDVEYQPVGHPGFEIPHFDIHAYFISDEEQHKIATTFVELKNAEGEKIGFAAFGQMGPETIMLKVNASGLTPGKHGFHIHDQPIANNDFATAAGHFNPTGKKHGHDNPEGAHLGDLPNLVVDETGYVDQTIILSGVSLQAGEENSIIGKSLIIHAGEDDGVTDPAGDAGARVGGGNIE